MTIFWGVYCKIISVICILLVFYQITTSEINVKRFTLIVDNNVIDLNIPMHHLQRVKQKQFLFKNICQGWCDLIQADGAVFHLEGEASGTNQEIERIAYFIYFRSDIQGRGYFNKEDLFDIHQKCALQKRYNIFFD